MRGTASQPLRSHMKVAGGLLGAGLAVEAVTMLWAHPTAFLVFAMFGGGLVFAGVAVYLWSLFSD